MQTANETVINVQEIEPRLRHQTIFQVFNTLQEGESLIIHNNHDPKPVYYQLMDLRGNIFSWQYLQEGPEWWDIRVTRIVAIVPTEDKDFIINIPIIEPRMKHATIFHVYDSLKAGESFIIHNNHDPKPVYYQLADQHGNTFTWEYLQQGPEWWNIRVTKKETAQQAPAAENNTTASVQDGETVLDIPSLEPRLKHPTIFKTFDGLQAGESFIIHNDHDPKPVYYQLLNERGDVFTWEYLLQGPQWWDIRVTRKGEESTETIGEIVAKDMRKAQVFKKYGIDFCCGGKKTVRQACAEQGIDAAQVERELRQPVQGITTGNMNFDDWSVDFLADFIVNTHHQYVRKYLPEIMGYAAKVAQVHGTHHPELLKIKELFAQVNQELSQHLIDEESKLFPAIKELSKAKNSQTAYNNTAGETFNAMVATTEQEHDNVGRLLDQIRKLSHHYTIPEDACTSYKLLFTMLEEFENDLFIHIHLENNLLFPKALDIEKSLS